MERPQEWWLYSAHARVHAALIAVSEAVDSLRDPRKELIHATAFSNLELGLFASIQAFWHRHG